MTGRVDSSGRALLRIRLRHPASGAENEVDAWIDTGFTGELAMPQAQVSSLDLPIGNVVRASLADGSEIAADTYGCLVEWFGEWKPIEVISTAGQFPLLGVGLLQGYTLSIDYRAQTLTVD